MITEAEDPKSVFKTIANSASAYLERAGFRLISTGKWVKHYAKDAEEGQWRASIYESTSGPQMGVWVLVLESREGSQLQHHTGKSLSGLTDLLFRLNLAEAEDPKAVFKSASGMAAPSPDKGKEVSGALLRRLCARYLVNGVYIWYQEGKFPAAEGVLQINFRNYGLIRQDWASFGTLAGALLRWRNLEGAPLWINGKYEDKVSPRHEVLRHIDSSIWRPGGVHTGIEEARKKKPEPEPVGENPKRVFKQMMAAHYGVSTAYQDVLQYMPKDFVDAFRKREHAEWRQDDLSYTDNWPEYDSDHESWHEVFYYFNYYTEDGALYLMAMRGDMDGDHDCIDQAEVGSPEAAQMEKDYGSAGWHEAMRDYYNWVIAHREDPLGYIRIPVIEVKNEYLVGFVKQGEQLKIWGIRQLTPEQPSPPPVEWPALKEKAAQDEDWKKALEYCLVNDEGITEATEEEIVREGGKWDKSGRLVLRFSIDEKRPGEAKEEFIVNQAQAALNDLGQP